MVDRISVRCPECSTKLAVSDESKLGKKIRCPKCSQVFVAEAMNSGKSKSTPSKAKPKKSADEELDFDEMEMDDSSDSDDEESNGQPGPGRRKSGRAARSKGKQRKSSSSNLPVILSCVFVVALLLGVGGYVLSRGGGAGAVTTSQPVAQPTASSPSGTKPDQKRSDEGSLPTIGASKSTDIPTTAKAPPKPTPSERLGETAPVVATNKDAWPAGTQSLTARTVWHWTRESDSTGAYQNIINLVIEIQGDFLSKACAFGSAEIKTLQSASAQSIAVFQPLVKKWSDPLYHDVPYDLVPRTVMYSHPENSLRFVIPLVAPKATAAKLDAVEGQFRIKLGRTIEDILIPDVRAAANKPLEHESLKAANAQLVLRSANSPLGMTEVLEFLIGPTHAVGLLVAEYPIPGFHPGQIIFEPDYEADVNGRTFSTRLTARLPPDVMHLPIKLFSELEDITVPFRFEEVPLPSVDKKPKTGR